MEECSCPAHTSDDCSTKLLYIFPVGIIFGMLSMHSAKLFLLEKYNLFLKIIQIVLEIISFILSTQFFWSKPLPKDFPNLSKKLYTSKYPVYLVLLVTHESIHTLSSYNLLDSCNSEHSWETIDPRWLTWCARTEFCFLVCSLRNVSNGEIRFMKAWNICGCFCCNQ